jgi:hypothetical protein
MLRLLSEGGTEGAEAYEQIQATVTNLSGRGMRIVLGRPLKLDTPVRVDFRMDADDTLLLGEVVYCIPEGDSYAIGLELRHSISHLSSLRNLIQQLLGEEAASRPQPVQPSLIHSR